MATCSEPPLTAVPRRSREDAFKDLLLKISHNMGVETVESLQFMGEIKRSGGPKPTAIDVLQTLRERGKFSPNSCGNLHRMLTEVHRCDLAELVSKYMDTYPPRPQQSTEKALELHDTTAAAGETAEQNIGSSAFSLNGSHITVAHNSGEDDGSETPAAVTMVAEHASEEHRRQVERYTSMTADVPHFRHSVGSLCPGSQLNGSQVMLEQGPEGLNSFHHSTSSLPSQSGPTNIAINIQLGSNPSHSPSPLSPPAPGPAKRSSDPAIPQQLPQQIAEEVESPTSCNYRTERQQPRSSEKRRSAMYSPLHEEPISEEQDEEKKEPDLGSPDASSASSTPKLSPMPSGRSPVQTKPRGPSDPQWLPVEGHQILTRKAPKATKGQKLTAGQTWVIKKSLLCQYIWYHKHRKEYLKCPKKVPIDIGCKDLNPSLSLLLFPFGLFNDNSSSMTLQIKLNIPDKCTPLLPTDSYHLSWEIRSQETKTSEGKTLMRPARPYRIPFDRGMFYIFKFLSHDAIKLCESSAFEIYVNTSYLCEDTSAANLQEHKLAVTPQNTDPSDHGKAAKLQTRRWQSS